MRRTTKEIESVTCIAFERLECNFDEFVLLQLN